MKSLDPTLKYLLLALWCGVTIYVVSQVRKPNRWIGRFFLWIMNSSHSALTDWGLGHITIGKDYQILDVGCGGGRTIQKLAALAVEGKVYGVDYAKGSVAASRANNSRRIAANQVEIMEASVSKLPFHDDTFDLVTAVETQYYWPNLIGDMQEVRRVLKPGGTLAVIVESYASEQQSWLARRGPKLLLSNRMSVSEQRQLFAEAGYETVQIFEQASKGWLCGIGSKPTASTLSAP